MVAAIVGDATEAHLRAQVAIALARYKQPGRYVMLSDLPRNTMGKVQKNLLRDRYALP